MAVALLGWWGGGPNVDALAVLAAVGVLLTFIFILAVLSSEKSVLKSAVAHALPLYSKKEPCSFAFGSPVSIHHLKTKKETQCLASSENTEDSR